MKYELAASSWDSAETDAIRRVVDSGFYSMGNEVLEFERRFADYLGSKHCVMVNSGSSANLLMVASLFYKRENPLKRGDEVIVPAVSWPTTYYPLHQHGLKLKFVDIDRNTLNFDLNALENAISTNTRLIFAVNLLGNSNDYDAIEKMIAGRDIALIEDNCESMGGEWNGRKLGTIGLTGSFSTYFSHHMSTMEGGVVSTDDEELYHILLSIRSHGWTRHLPEQNLVCRKHTDPFEESFRFVLPGYNVRPTEIAGAIGTEQLKKLPGFIEARRRNAVLFNELFGNDPRFTVQRELGKSSWFGFSLLINDDAVCRRSVIEKLSKAGIETRPIVAGNFLKKEVVRWLDCEAAGPLPNADYIDERGFFVGNHHFDITDQLMYLHKTLSD
jgi:CDP-6-deoxy-D-xylo-4-hexulose-3-dehydrase